jgi:AcrR family transcriptional regulator
MAVATTPKQKKALATGKGKARLEPVRDAERTHEALLAAAEVEFATKGLAGARVDVISEQAKANKRMLYYYFGSKEKLYLAVLERVYCAMREAERELNLANLAPLDAIRTLVEFKFDYYQKNTTTIPLLAGENMLGAYFLKRSLRLREMHLSVVDVLGKLLAAGERAGDIRPGIDPLHLYISMSSLSYFYFSNAATLSAAFGRPLASSAEQKLRRTHVVDVILAFVKAS